MLHHLLVATDFSERSERAVRRAKRIGETSGAALTLAHIVDAKQPNRILAPARIGSMSLLCELASMIREEGGSATEPLVLAAEPAAGILLAAEQVDADLLVIGSHRDRALGTFTGRTAERLVQTSPRPVLIAAMDPSDGYRRTLLALDLGEPALAAARASVSLGVFDHTQVTVMHVGDARACETNGAVAKLRELLSDMGLPSSTRTLVKGGSPSDAILAAAREEAADLVMLGTSQREGVARVLLGSVAAAVSMEGNHDMLIVPAG